MPPSQHRRWPPLRRPVSPALFAFATLGKGRNFFQRKSSTMSAFLQLETTSSLLMIIFTKLAWFDSFSNCSCSSFARKSCTAPSLVYFKRRMKLEQACLAFLVVCQPLWIELLDDLLWRVVLLDLALKVETHHVARVELVRQFKKLGQTLLFCLFYVLRRRINDEVHIDIVMVFLIVLPGTQHLSWRISNLTYLDHTITLLANHGFKLGFVGLRPLVDGDLNRGIAGLACDSGHVVLVVSRS